MSDYQRIVEFLRDFRTSGVQVVTDEVREAATAYAGLCASANERLRQCATLIQQGLRAEAVHLAESLPNLLDLVAALDLPDPEGWVELCRRADLPVPPTLQIDRATQLQDAYEQDEPLGQLYAVHRRMALSRAPYLKRLNVMRQIASADPSPFWDRDIRIFEHARFKEIRVEIAAAMRDRDAAAITALSREVRETPWVDTVPSDLAAAAREVDERIQSTRTDAAIREALARLHGAFTAKSLQECAALLDQLKELSAAQNGIGLPAEAAEQVRAAAAWVQQESRMIARRKAYNEACAALVQVLDAGASDSDLEIVFRAASDKGEPLPADLVNRYQNTLRARAQVTRWRYVGLFLGIAAVLAISLGVWSWRSQAGIARNWAIRIQQAANSHDLNLARQLVEEQERRAPGANSNTEVVAAKRAVTLLMEQAEHDRDLVKDILGELETAGRNATAAGETGDPEKWWSAVTAIDEALLHSRRVKEAKEFDPGNLVASTVSGLQSQQDDLRKRFSGWVSTQIDMTLQQAEPDNLTAKTAGITAAESRLAAAEQKLLTIRPYLDRAGAAASASANAATAKLGQFREAIRRSQSELDSVHAMAKSCTSVASARLALQQFAAQYPASATSQEFAKAAAAADLYESVERWNALRAPWFTTPAVANEKDALQRLELAQDFIRDYPQCPLLPRATAYADYLKQAADAMATQNTWQREMGEVLGSPLIADLGYIETSEKTRYYVLGDPNVKKQGIGDRIRLTFEVIDPENLIRRRTITLGANQTLASEKPTPLPHTLFVHSLVEQMKTVDDRNWETWGIGLIDRLLAEEKIDPVVRAILLREALQATAHVDGWAIGGLYDRSISELVRQKLDSVCWYDPEHPVSAVTLANLRTIVANVPRGDEARKLLPVGKAALFALLRPPVSGVGMLLKDEAGHWQIVMAPGTALGESALAIAPRIAATSPAASQAAVSPAKVVKVAHKEAKGMVVDEATVRELPQGTLVFLSNP